MTATTSCNWCEGGIVCVPGDNGYPYAAARCPHCDGTGDRSHHNPIWCSACLAEGAAASTARRSATRKSAATRRQQRHFGEAAS